MLKWRKQRGVTLIELMVGLAVLAILVSLGLPAFNQMIRNAQVRSHAESVQRGVMLARSEALKRNQQVRFSLVSTLDANCTLSASGNFWLVSRGDADVTGQCHLSANPDPAADALLLHKSDGGARPASLVSVSLPALTSSQLCFNGLGQLQMAGSICRAATYRINVQGPAGSTCGAAEGEVRCMSVRVQRGGAIRLCDPAVADATDNRSCAE